MSASGREGRAAERYLCNCVAGWLSLSARCGAERVFRRLERYLLRCRDCRHQTSVTAGTIFQDTPPLLCGLWFQAIWWVVSQKNGVSALGCNECWV